MRDDDKMLELPPVFGSGIVGVCDICGTRQAVVVLSKERFKLCVVDFLNKTWLKTTQKPGAPLPLYRSERVWYSSDSVPAGKAPGIALAPTKPVKRPGILLTPDVYGITTTQLDAAIRFAREGFEVFVPDVAKTEGIGPSYHLALRSGVRVRGGVHSSHPKVETLTSLYEDALAYLRGRELVDPTRTALVGISYGGSLALHLAARDQKLAAVVLAYPMPVQPAELARLVTAPMLFVGGSDDRWAHRAGDQVRAARTEPAPAVEFLQVPGGRHEFLSRDMSAYDVRQAEFAWSSMLAFLKERLMPPPPRPPSIPAPPPTTPAARPGGPAPAAASGPARPAAA